MFFHSIITLLASFWILIATAHSSFAIYMFHIEITTGFIAISLGKKLIPNKTNRSFTTNCKMPIWYGPYAKSHIASLTLIFNDSSSFIHCTTLELKTKLGTISSLTSTVRYSIDFCDIIMNIETTSFQWFSKITTLAVTIPIELKRYESDQLDLGVGTGRFWWFMNYFWYKNVNRIPKTISL